MVEIRIETDYFLPFVRVYHKIILKFLSLAFLSFHKQKLKFRAYSIFCVFLKCMSKLNQLRIYKLIVMQLAQYNCSIWICSIIAILFDIINDFDSFGLWVVNLSIHAQERVTK